MPSGPESAELKLRVRDRRFPVRPYPDLGSSHREGNVEQNVACLLQELIGRTPRNPDQAPAADTCSRMAWSVFPGNVVTSSGAT